MTMPNDSSADAPIGTMGAEPADNTRTASTAGARAQIREVKEQVVDQAKSSFRQAKDSAGSSFNDSRNKAADKIGGLASAVRSTSEHLRSEHQEGVANLTDSLAEQVERVSSYLRDRDLSDLRSDLDGFARRQPAVAVGVALALGMLGARFLKSSRQSSSSRRSFRNDESDRDRYDYGSRSSGGYGGYGTGSQPAGGRYGGA